MINHLPVDPSHGQSGNGSGPSPACRAEVQRRHEQDNRMTSGNPLEAVHPRTRLWPSHGWRPAWVMAPVLLFTVMGQGRVQAQPPDYCQLEHVDADYLSQINSLGSSMQYANFQMTGWAGNFSTSWEFMVTLFYDAGAGLFTNPEDGSWGTSVTANHRGAWGIYVFNMDLGLQSGPRYSTTGGFSSGVTFELREVHQIPTNGLIEDSITLNSGAATGEPGMVQFHAFENNLSGSPNSVSLVTLHDAPSPTLGNALTLAGNPFNLTSSSSLSYYSETPNWFGENYMTLSGDTGVICSGVVAAVPEPSTGILALISGLLAMTGRHRRARR